MSSRKLPSFHFAVVVVRFGFNGFLRKRKNCSMLMHSDISRAVVLGSALTQLSCVVSLEATLHRPTIKQEEEVGYEIWNGGEKSLEQ